MIITGTITKKELKTSSKGLPYVCFTIDDKNWNCFDALVHSQFNVGDIVTITTKTQGKFENMVTMVKATQDSSKSDNSSPCPVPAQKSAISDKDRRIIAALKEIISALNGE